MAIKAQPKVVGGNFADRFMGNYNGQATITGVDIIKSDTKPELNGSIAVHLRATVITNNTKTNIELVDWYGKKRPQTPATDFAQQMLNRATGAQLSAGVKMFDKEIDEKDARKTVANIFKKLIGKQVNISQYYKEGYNVPNIRYKFDEVTDEDVADESDDDELPL